MTVTHNGDVRVTVRVCVRMPRIDRLRLPWREQVAVRPGVRVAVLAVSMAVPNRSGCWCRQGRLRLVRTPKAVYRSA